MKPTTNPAIIYQTDATIIIALSPTEIGKVVLPSPYVFVDAKTNKPVDFIGGEAPTLEKEMATLIFANSINDLMPKFLEKRAWQDKTTKKTYDMLVMERLEILPIDHYDLPSREKMLKDFEEKMEQLHDVFFVHGDFIRPTNYYTRGNLEWMFGNIVQTRSRLRLLDTGFSKICNKDNIRLFAEVLIRERTEVSSFGEYYLNLGE